MNVAGTEPDPSAATRGGIAATVRSPAANTAPAGKSRAATTTATVGAGAGASAPIASATATASSAAAISRR